jgi:hypothetical protein
MPVESAVERERRSTDTTETIQVVTGSLWNSESVQSLFLISF